MSNSRGKSTARSRAYKASKEVKQIQNTFTQLVEGLGNSAGTGGSQLSSYQTMAWTNNYALVTLNHILLTYFYAGNGIFQTAIQVPIQDAISKGIELESDELSSSDIDDLMDYWEHDGIWDTILNAMTWSRLYGGGAIVVGSSGDPSQPITKREIMKSELEFYDVDRWQLQMTKPNTTDFDSWVADEPINDRYWLYNTMIDKSRTLIMTGKRAPSRIRRTLLGWGMSEGERMIRDLNLYTKTQDVLFEILDEAKIDVYKMAGLNSKLMSGQGTQIIQRRVEMANQIKNYLNALLLDKDDDFDQKSMTFSGLAEVSNENRIGVAAALRIPMVKLFGLSPSGFSTGETDLDNYNQMVESDVRSRLNAPVRRLLEITALNKFGFVPSFRFEWPPMKEATEKEQAEINQIKTTNIVTLYTAGLITGQEAMEEIQKAGVYTGESQVAQGMEPSPPQTAEEPNVPEGVPNNEEAYNRITNTIKIFRSENK